MDEEQIARFQELAKRRNKDKTVYEDSSFFDNAKDSISKSGIGKLFGYGSKSDRSKNGYGEGFFDAPRTLNMDGKRYSTDNKIFNDMGDEELSSYIKQNVVKSDDNSQRHLYKLRNRRTGEVKYGTAKTGVPDRYKNDQGLQNWTVEFDEPVDNADEIETTIHGSKSARDRRSYDFGRTKNAPLASGGSEIYTPLEQVIKKNPVAGQAISKIDKILKPEQKSMFNDIMNYADKVGEGFQIATGYKDAKDVGQDAKFYSEDGTTRPERMAKATGEFVKDLGLGASLDVDKLLGGVTGLLNKVSGDSFKDEQQFWKDRASINTKAMSDKDGIGSTIGEILPELAIPATTALKSANTAKNILMGTLSGGAINYSTEALKEQSDIKQGLDENKELAGGVGAVIGGIVGAMTKNTKLAKMIEESVNSGLSPEQAMKQYGMSKDNIRQVSDKLEESTSLEKLTSVMEGKKARDIKVKKVIEEKVPYKPETKIVKPDRQEGNVKIGTDETTTKSGLKQKNKALAEQEKSVRTSETKVVDPRQHKSKELEDQIPVPAKDDSYHAQLGWDFRGRTYDENGKAINSQGGDESKFSQSIQPRQKITDIKTELSRRMGMYNREAELRKQYGQAQARLTESPRSKSKAKQEANRRQFERDNLFELSKDKSLPKELRDEARELAKEVGVVTEKVVPKIVKDQVLDRHDEQYPTKVDVEQLNSRNEELKAEYENLPEKDKKFKESLNDKFSEDKENKIRQTVVDMVEEMKPKVKLANTSLEDIAKGLGKKYKAEMKHPQLNQHQSTVRDYAQLKDDLERYDNGEINLVELRDRVAKRISDKEYENTKIKFSDSREYKEWKDKDDKLHDDLNLPRRKVMRKKETGNYESNPAEELAKSKMQNKRRQEAIQKGTADLSPLEDRLLKSGADYKEISQIKAPVGSKMEQDRVREHATEKLITEHNNRIREDLGLPKVKADKTIQEMKPVDTTTDFSNSVGQNSALLLADKNLGDFTKLTGKTDDLRQRIAEVASKALGREITKSDIKPLFMQQMYGQMEKGLLKAIKGDKELFDQYEKVMKEEFSGFKKLSDAFYELGKKSNGEFKFSLPDNFKVEFNLKGKHQGKVKSTNGKTTQQVEVEKKGYDDFSRALAPNIMHAVDGYIVRTIARKLAREGIDARTIHDALTFRNEYTDRVMEVALQVQKDVLNSNLLDDIMKQLGYKGKPLKNTGENKLTAEDLDKSKGISMSFEHIANEIQKMKVRPLENSKLVNSETAMKEYMARGNVKLSGTEQLIDDMVTEAGYNSGKYAIARESDDVYERAMASALQGKKLPLVKPKTKLTARGRRLYDKVQADIRREARAKVERNPLLKDIVQGERRFFDKNGKWMHSDTKTYDEILEEEAKRFTKAMEEMSPIRKKTIESIVPSKVSVVKNQEGIKPSVGYKELLAEMQKKSNIESIARHEARKLIDEVQRGNNSRWEQTKQFFKTQIDDSKTTKDYNSLFEKNKRAGEVAGIKTANMQKMLDKLIPKDMRKKYTILLDTDFNAIKEFDRTSGKQFFKDNMKVYKQAKEYIDKASSALNRNENKVGRYLNNPTLIAKQAGLPKDTVPIIDKLISLKAMSPEAWEFVAKNKDTNAFKTVMNILDENKKISQNILFKKNPDSFIKGFTKEVNDNGKEISKEGKVQWKTDSGYENGAIPIHSERAKIGHYQDQEHRPKTKMTSYEEKLEYAEKHNLKITEKGSFRKVADGKIRDEAGREKDFNRILTETYGSIQKKLEQRKVVSDIIEELINDSNSMISRTKKEGMVKLTDEQKDMLPNELKQQLRYVNKDFIEPLLGREEVRMYKGDNQGFKILDKAVANAFTSFKKNVVLKNPSSYKNAIIVNTTIGLMSGVSPSKLMKYQSQAIKEAKMNTLLLERIHRLESQGKDATRFKTRLEKSELYKFEEAGLSTNRVEGVRGADSMIGSMIDSVTGKDWIKNAVNEVALSQKGYAGRETVKAFSYIDTMGRFTLAKHFAETMPIKEAVHKANGLFADMDRFAPAWIEMADKYGLPFVKWFSLSTPQLLKVTKENIGKTFAVGATVYGLSMLMNTNFDSQNPILAVLDFGTQQVMKPFDVEEEIDKKGTVETLGKSVTPFVLPNVYKEVYNELTRENNSMIWKDRPREPKSEKGIDRRGLFQQIEEGMGYHE